MDDWNLQEQATADLLADLKDEARHAYQQMDKLLAELLEHRQAGDSIKLSDGRTLTLVDKFAGGNKQWKSTCFNRFDVEITKAA